MQSLSAVFGRWSTVEKHKQEITMKNKKVWIALIVIIALGGAGYFFRSDVMSLIKGATGGTTSAQVPGSGFDPANITTTTIRPASEAEQVSAAGNIEVTSQRPVVLQVGSIVTQVEVEVGDQVAANELLVALDTADLERAVEQAKLNLASSQAQLDELREPADAAEIASAQASLASAQQNLAEVQAGPSQAELAAAEASLAAAQARYQELLDGPSDAELTELSASLEKALIDLQQAQWAYDRIAYQDSAGTSSQAATLQQATIDYESAKAAYEISVEPASEADLQDALGEIQNAQEQLNNLRAQPTDAELASAQAQVASAQANLDGLLRGPSQAESRAAEISVEQAQLDLEAAQAELAKAQLLAPMAGTVLAVDVEVGEQVQAGLNAVTLADLKALELTVNVAEVDISKATIGQPAKITVDALPDKVFSGVVTRIAPSSTSDSGVVNYPVTVQLSDADLSGIRPGMTAVADLLSEEMADSWLVPTSAVRERDGKTMVMILRDGQPTPIQVTTQGTEGEWTVVQSPELQEGDEAIGAVSSFLNQENEFRGFGGPPGGGVMPPR
jgi:HlyD family secretion protein